MADIDAPLAWRMQQDGYLMQINQLRDENAKLCAEVERLHADQAHWELGNCPSCPNVVSLQEALEQNAKLRELVAELWALADGYTPDDSELDTARDLMRELGIEVEE